MEKTQVVAVRHGETEWNFALRVQGQQNSSLTTNGIRQAEQTADALKDYKFDILYTSGLQRAIDTATIINRYHNLEHRIDNSLAERNFGIMEGHSIEEIRSLYPEVYASYKSRDEKYMIPEGESLLQFFSRVSEGISRIAELHKGGNLLIVTHGGVLDCIIRMILDYPVSGIRKFSLYNAAVNRFSYSGGTWFLEEWGNIVHHQVRSLSLDA